MMFQIWRGCKIKDSIELIKEKDREKEKDLDGGENKNLKIHYSNICITFTIYFIP